jgi:cell division ATPase FtsA
VEKLLALFSEADIPLSALIPVSLSLQNLLAHSKREEECVAVVEMGASVTELNIFREGQLAFSRKLPVDGNDITRALTSTLMSSQGKVELSVEEAERVKKERGLPVGDEEGLIDGKIQPIQILSLVRPCVEQLAGEIDRSFDFFREESHGGKVQKIILFGGGANLKRLVEFLKDELEVAVEVTDAFEGIPVVSGALDEKSPARSRFDLAAGAALSRAEKINLLPVELKERTRRFIENVSFKGIGAGILVSVLLFYMGLQIQLFGLNKKMSALLLEKRSLVPQMGALRERILIGGIFKNQPYWEDVLKEIGHVIPPEIILVYLQAEDDVLHLKGEIRRADQNSQAVLSRFMMALEKGIFQNVNLVMTQKKSVSPDIVEFEVICTVE